MVLEMERRRRKEEKSGGAKANALKKTAPNKRGQKDQLDFFSGFLSLSFPPQCSFSLLFSVLLYIYSVLWDCICFLGVNSL